MSKMGKNVVSFFEEMGERDPNLKPGLTCHVEIDNTTGSKSKDIDVSTAAALRTLAAQIEAGELESGFYPVNTPSGEKIGEVYLDYYYAG